MLFPEGTTSDGSRVLPFRSAFFALAEGARTPPLIQPVSVVYDRLGGLPTGRASRPVFAWYGDMDIASHFWRFAQHRGLRVSVLLHAPLDPLALRQPQGAVAGGLADGGRWRVDAAAEPAGRRRRRQCRGSRRRSVGDGEPAFACLTEPVSIQLTG